MQPYNSPLIKTLAFGRKGFLFFVFILCSFSAIGQLSVETNRQNATYQVGESMTFKVTSSSGGQVTWVLKYDNNAPIISSGTLNVSAGQSKTISYTATEPGVVLCQVTKGNSSALASAAFDPFDIAPFVQEPSDLDAFWNNQKAELASVPMGAVVTSLQSDTYTKTYRIQLNNIDGRKVYGYLTIPNGNGPFPAIVVMPPYGSITNLAAPEEDLAAKGGVIALSISIHNAPPDQIDPNAYEPDNYADEEESYYRYGLLGAIRAIDYIFTRSDFDGTNVGVNGVSQGAGLAMIIAGLDDRVKLLAYSNPVLCQNSGLSANRAGGFPNFVQRSRNEFGTASHEAATIDATRYYDAMFFARRFTGPTLALLSYEDIVTPSATGFAAFNELSGTKILCHSPELGHTHPNQYWNGRYEFFRRFFPTTQNTPPFPYNPDTKGYDIDAGQNISTSGNSANLSGSIKYNNTNNPNFQVKWKKISGAGNVSFSNSNNYNTTATFSVAGTYVLEFSGRDESLLNSEAKFYTMMDQVTVVAGSGGGDTTPPSVTLSTNSNNVNAPFLVNVNFSESINGLSLNDFNKSNATLSNLSGSGSFYSLMVNPSAAGQVTISLPSGRVTDASNNPNTSSNTLTINYSPSNSDDCETPINLSKNKVTSQHSTQFNAVSGRAVDGITNGDFWAGNSTSLTNWTSNAWWEVDLGAEADITDINIWNRTECCENVLVDYHVFVSEEPFNSTSVSATLAQSGVTDFFQSSIAGTPTNISVDESGRYVRIQLDGQGFLALAEVEVMGCFDDDVQLDQNITFPSIPNKFINDSPFTIGASASSGLPVTFDVLSGPASLTGGNLVTLNGTPGIVTIRASQAGNSTYNPAPSVSRSFTVSTPSQSNCTNTSNIALGKTATQHSTQFSAFASRAVDGNTNGHFWNGASVSLTNWVPNAWWEVDLGQIGNIDKVRIWNRTDCCGERLKDFFVLVSDVPFNSTDLNSALNQNGVSDYFRGQEAALPSEININRTGRYVRIQLQGTAFLGLAEVEVIGCFETSGCPPAGTACNDGDSNTENDVEDGNCGCSGTPIGGSCTSTSNVALNKNTSQISTISAAGITGSSSKAVDGNTNGTFFTSPTSASSVSATQTQNQPWWEVDLGANYFIEDIKVYNRTDGQDRTRNCYVMVSDQPFTSHSLTTTRNQADYEEYISGLVGSPSMLSPNITGRYVRVQLSGSGYLVLGEVEVIGCASNNLNNTNTLIALPTSEFLHFYGDKNNRAVEMEWVTNMEPLNDFFTIERSRDGVEFEFLMDVESKTNSLSPVAYSEMDNEPYFGRNYYRLIQTLIDGTEIYSQVFNVDFDVDLQEFSIFPNPAQDLIYVNLKEFSGEKGEIKIYDARGVLVHERKLEVVQDHPEMFDLKKYVNGLYLMTIKIEGQRIITRQFLIKDLY